MPRSLTNNTNLQYSIEETLGNLFASPSWFTLEPNDISSFGANISTVARNPISKNRQRRKGTITNIESSVEINADLTMSSLQDFIEGFCFSAFSGGDILTATDVATGVVTMAETSNIIVNTLVRVTGLTATADNGLHVVTAVTVDTSITIAALTDVTENFLVEVVGHRFAVGDLDVLDANNLTTTSQDLTLLGLVAGQSVHVGGFLAANQFAAADNSGLIRVSSVAANVLTFDKALTTFTTEADASQLIDMYFGKFVRNVPTDNPNYIERSYQFELEYATLDAGDLPMYEYARGNLCNELTFETPLTDKATLAPGFIGTDTAPPVNVAGRATNAATPTDPQYTTAFNTSADIARIRVADVDDTGLTSDFKSLSITINNNVTPENVLGVTGAKYINAGNLEIGFEAEMIFSNSVVAERIRSNATVSLDFRLTNDDGTIAFDIPSLTLGGGARSFPVNETVLISTTGEAYADDAFNTSIGITIFNHALPIDPANPFL
ncbi:MAG: hypothetical protein COB09_18515 [Thalassobium sp.]|nr:MAG: hypothetical protein COB09_18515 [Thalassobium sp.]